MAAAAAAAAAAASDAPEADLRSATGASPACTHRFRNERASPVSIWWLDYEGRAMRYGEIGPNGGSADQATFEKHAWRLCDEASGVALAELVGASATVTLQADGSVKVSVGLPPGAQIKGGEAAGGAAVTAQAAAAAAGEGQPAGADMYSEFT